MSSTYLITLIIGLLVGVQFAHKDAIVCSQIAQREEQHRIDQAQVTSRDVQAVLAWQQEKPTMANVKDTVQRLLQDSPLVVLQVSDGDGAHLQYEVAGAVMDALVLANRIEESIGMAVVQPLHLEGKEGVTHMAWQVSLR